MTDEDDEFDGLDPLTVQALLLKLAQAHEDKAAYYRRCAERPENARSQDVLWEAMEP